MVLIIKTTVKSIKCRCLICNRFKLFLSTMTQLGLRNSKGNHNDLKVGVADIKQNEQRNITFLTVGLGTRSLRPRVLPTRCFRGTLAKTGMTQCHDWLHLCFSEPTCEHIPTAQHHRGSERRVLATLLFISSKTLLFVNFCTTGKVRLWEWGTVLSTGALLNHRGVHSTAGGKEIHLQRGTWNSLGNHSS